MTENTISWKRNCCAPILLALVLVWSPLSVFGGLEVFGDLPKPARVALVIGNASYEEHGSTSQNTANDAVAVGAALDRLGFDVDRVEDAGFTALRRSLVTFARKTAEARLAVVYFSGIGLGADGRNFLAPVDFSVDSDDDIEFKAVPVQLALRAVERASDYGIVILDMNHSSPVEPPLGTLVAYSANPGAMVWDALLDGSTRNSPYTTELLRYLEEPGLDVGEMFRKVRDAVMLSTESQYQQPVTYGWVPAEGFYLTAPPESPTEAPAAER